MITRRNFISGVGALFTALSLPFKVSTVAAKPTIPMWFEPGMTTIDADAKMSLLMQLHKKQIISRTLLLESWYGIDYDKEVEQLRQEQLMSQEG